jgi:hypothetical protein
MSRLGFVFVCAALTGAVSRPVHAAPTDLGRTTTLSVVGVPTATPPALPAPPPPRPSDGDLRKRDKSSRALLVSGLLVGGTAYLLTSMSGALAIDRARDFEDDPLTEEDESATGDQRRAFGRALLVPVGGPFLAIARADTALRGWGAGIGGVMQGVGLGLTIAGIVGRVRVKQAQRLAFAPMAGREGAGLTMAVRF